MYVDHSYNNNQNYSNQQVCVLPILYIDHFSIRLAFINSRCVWCLMSFYFGICTTKWGSLCDCDGDGLHMRKQKNCFHYNWSATDSYKIVAMIRLLAYKSKIQSKEKETPRRNSHSMVIHLIHNHLRLLLREGPFEKLIVAKPHFEAVHLNKRHIYNILIRLHPTSMHAAIQLALITSSTFNWKVFWLGFRHFLH